VSEAWLSAVAAVIVAILGIVGSLAGTWNSRHALKDELEIARLINEVYPDDGRLKRRIHARVSHRLNQMDRWNLLVPTVRFLVVGFVASVFGILLEFLKPWLAGLGGVSADTADLLSMSAPYLTVVAWICILGATVTVVVDIFVELRRWKNRTGRSDAPKPLDHRSGEAEPHSLPSATSGDSEHPLGTNAQGNPVEPNSATSPS